jgi:hypothetical protein
VKAWAAALLLASTAAAEDGFPSEMRPSASAGLGLLLLQEASNARTPAPLFSLRGDVPVWGPLAAVAVLRLSGRSEGTSSVAVSNMYAALEARAELRFQVGPARFFAALGPGGYLATTEIRERDRALHWSLGLYPGLAYAAGVAVAFDRFEARLEVGGARRSWRDDIALELGAGWRF